MRMLDAPLEVSVLNQSCALACVVDAKEKKETVQRSKGGERFVVGQLARHSSPWYGRKRVYWGEVRLWKVSIEVLPD